MARFLDAVFRRVLFVIEELGQTGYWLIGAACAWERACAARPPIGQRGVGNEAHAAKYGERGPECAPGRVCTRESSSSRSSRWLLMDQRCLRASTARSATKKPTLMEESSQVLPESCIKIFISDINACNVHYKRAPRLKLVFLYTLRLNTNVLRPHIWELWGTYSANSFWEHLWDTRLYTAKVSEIRLST